MCVNIEGPHKFITASKDSIADVTIGFLGGWGEFGWGAFTPLDETLIKI